MAKKTKEENLSQADLEAVKIYTKDKTLKELRDQREEIEKKFNQDLTILNRLLESFYAYCKWEKSVLKREERAELIWDTQVLQELNLKVSKLIEENQQLLPTEETGRISKLPLIRQFKAAMGRLIWFFIKPRIAAVTAKQMAFNSELVNLLNRNNEIYRQLFEIQRTYNHQLMLFFQKIIPLINAKDVEVIRLLTYLPLKRTDLIFEEFDKKQEYLHQSLRQQQEELNKIFKTLRS